MPTRMWAVRSALGRPLARASNTAPQIDAGPLTGHVSDTNATQRGYEAELTLTNKQRLLEGINFGFVLNAGDPTSVPTLPAAVNASAPRQTPGPCF